MTLSNYKSVIKLVEEMGKENVEAIFEYQHTFSKETLYAVFTKGSYVDIYQSPFCSCIEQLFGNGRWINMKLIERALLEAVTGEKT